MFFFSPNHMPISVPIIGVWRLDYMTVLSQQKVQTFPKRSSELALNVFI